MVFQMDIAICDDSIDYIGILEKYFDKMKRFDLCYDTFLSGEDLLAAYKNNGAVYDAIFLDMEMGGIDGIETANIIRSIDKRVIIVFITSYTKYMKRSFECLPFRFLVKPVSFEDMEKVMCAVYRRLSEEKSTFVFYENRNKVRLFCENILYFECQSHWILIHEKDNIYKICRSMSDLYDQIDQSVFCRVHNSYIINFNYVKRIYENTIELYDTDKIIPVSRTYKKDFTRGFIRFKERRYLI